MAGKAQELTAKVNFGGQVDQSFGKALASVKSGVAGALGAAAKVVAKMAGEYQSAYRKIRIGTGATGQAVKGLMGDMEAVLSRSASSMSDVAEAISGYNTIFGESGTNLQDISAAALDVSRIFGEDLQAVVQSSGKALRAWGRTAKDGAESLNFMRKVSQATGVSVTDLQERTARYQPTLKALGYSLESSAVLIGNLEKSGVRGERAISALNKISAMGAEQWAGYYQAIRDAKDETDAINIASEAFGKEGGAAMASAVRSGAFAVGELTNRLKADEESLSDLSSDVETFDDVMTRLSNAMTTLFLPALKEITKAAEGLASGANWVSRYWNADENERVRMEMDVNKQLNRYFDEKWRSLTGQEPKKYALGGWTSGPSIAGEAGPEAVISLDPSVRAQNVQLWREAGQALGIGRSSGLSADFSGLVFAPTINAGGSDSTDVIAALRGQERELADLIIGTLNARDGRLA